MREIKLLKGSKIEGYIIQGEHVSKQILDYNGSTFRDGDGITHSWDEIGETRDEAIGCRIFLLNKKIKKLKEDIEFWENQRSSD